MVIIKIELTVDKINNILAILATQPYENVASLIDDIKKQADPQFEESQRLPGINE